MKVLLGWLLIISAVLAVVRAAISVMQNETHGLLGNAQMLPDFALAQPFLLHGCHLIEQGMAITPTHVAAGSAQSLYSARFLAVAFSESDGMCRAVCSRAFDSRQSTSNAPTVSLPTQLGFSGGGNWQLREFVQDLTTTHVSIFSQDGANG